MEHETELEIAERHIREGLARIERQQEIIEKLQSVVHPTHDMERLLETFLLTLNSHLSHRNLIIAEMKGLL
jgi:hypothetical protein